MSSNKFHGPKKIVYTKILCIFLELEWPINMKLAIRDRHGRLLIKLTDLCLESSRNYS